MVGYTTAFDAYGNNICFFGFMNLVGRGERAPIECVEGRAFIDGRFWGALLHVMGVMHNLWNGWFFVSRLLLW